MSVYGASLANHHDVSLRGETGVPFISTDAQAAKLDSSF